MKINLNKLKTLTTRFNNSGMMYLNNLILQEFKNILQKLML
jgi:hypothetical protein